jgi:hypothetical protein
MSSLEWILIIAAFALVAVLWVTLYPRPRLRIGDRGFLDRELQLGWIRWDEIEGAYSPNVRDSDGIRIKLRPGHKLLRRLRRRNRANASEDGSFELRIDLSETDISPVEMLQELISRSAHPTR